MLFFGLLCLACSTILLNFHVFFSNFVLFFALGPLGRLSKSSWGLLAQSWRVLKRSWGILAPLGAILEPLGPLLGASWASLGRLLARLGRLLGASWGLLEGSWAPLGASWQPRRGPCVFWAQLGAVFEAMLASFLVQIGAIFHHFLILS